MRFTRINLAFLAILFILVIGVLGFRELEGFDWLDSFYMTIITLSTVGFGEIRPLSDNGRLFTAFLIITSFGIFAYGIHAITSYIFSGEFRDYFKNRKLKKTLGRMKDHVIICGYGRNGKRAALEFIAHRVDFIVIEEKENIISDVKNDPNVVFIHGDSTQDEILEKAKIHEARALIATLPIDADNLLTVLTAREMNKALLIISRASYDSSYSKLKLAGADNVIMPDRIGGAHMATLVLKPDVVEFFDQIIMQDPDTPYLREIICADISDDENNYTLGELKEVNRSGVTIIGAKSAEGDYVVNPSNDYKLTPNSKLFVLGTPEQIASL